MPGRATPGVPGWTDAGFAAVEPTGGLMPGAAPGTAEMARSDSTLRSTVMPDFDSPLIKTL